MGTAKRLPRRTLERRAEDREERRPGLARFSGSPAIAAAAEGGVISAAAAAPGLLAGALPAASEGRSGGGSVACPRSPRIFLICAAAENYLAFICLMRSSIARSRSAELVCTSSTAKLVSTASST